MGRPQPFGVRNRRFCPCECGQQCTMARRQLVFVLAAALALAITTAGCGGGDEGAGTTTAQRSDVRVALVTDIGGLNDRGFNALANKGLKAAERDLGINGRVFVSDAAT